MSMDLHGLPVPPPVPHLWEVHEVAVFLRMNPETVRRLIRARELPAIQVGTRSWRVDPADVKAFVDARRTLTTREQAVGSVRGAA
jgi:excisionase family DNA binding protein